MQELPHPWGEYARLQARSSRNSTIDSYSWGVEAEMNLFLANPHAYTPAEAQCLERVRVTTARRERSRAYLRKLHETELAPESADPTNQLEARQALQLIEAKVKPDQWAMISAVGQGYDYADVAIKHAISVGAARAQMFRFRQQFGRFRPAA